jgi:hypothetical protein
METREVECVQLHECCVVPYRRTQFGVEFCLVTPVAENRWEFPKIALDPDAVPSLEVLSEAASSAGLQGRIEAERLGDFAARRGNELRSMIGYLMHVDSAAEAWPRQHSHKRQWCLAEECRVRIRRKPLRQFIDLALHAVAVLPHPVTNGNGHSHANGHTNGNGQSAHHA